MGHCQVRLAQHMEMQANDFEKQEYISTRLQDEQDEKVFLA